MEETLIHLFAVSQRNYIGALCVIRALCIFQSRKCFHLSMPTGEVAGRERTGEGRALVRVRQRRGPLPGEEVGQTFGVGAAEGEHGQTGRGNDSRPIAAQ